MSFGPLEEAWRFYETLSAGLPRGLFALFAVNELRTLSRQANPEPLLRMADRAQRWSSLVDWSEMESTLGQLAATNALVPPDEAEEAGIVLLDPS